MTATTRGLVMVNTGNGKGKTTAALGIMLRAWGNNMRVTMLQFVKHSNVGEHRAAQRLGLEIVAGGAGRTSQGKNVNENQSCAVELWSMAMKRINSGNYDMVILDELTYPLKYGWLNVDEVLNVLKNRPDKLHVVITGRNAPQELIDFADTVVEIQDVKHHLRNGIKAQSGIEF